MQEYLIPKNVKTKFEFFSGFGWKELLVTFIGLVSGVVIYFIISIFTDHPAAFLVPIATTGFGFAISKPDPRTGLSLLQTLSSFKEFKTKPSTYYYQFGEGRVKK